MIILVWLLNFAISWFNAWGCGKTWNESKANGGFPHFMNWMGAIMSASGFTWCYLVIAGFLGATIPVEQQNSFGETISAPYLSGDTLQAFADLGYIVIIFPILGSGLAILVHSWGVAWRNRTIGNIGIAGWNTFAMGNNIYSAAQTLPGAFDRIGSFFGGSKSSSSDNKGRIIFILVALCAVGGILTTYSIIRATMISTGKARAFEYDLKAENRNYV